MKKTTAIMLALLCAIVFAQSEHKIAIHITSKIGASEKKALSTKMLASFINSGRFKAVEREDAFRNAQIQANADNSLVSSFGREYGASHVCMVDITQVLGSYQVSARVIDVGTETVVGRGEASSSLRTLEDLDVVANKIIAGMEALPPPQALQPLVYIPPPTPAPVPAPAPEPAPVPAPQPQEPPPQLQAEQQPVVPVVPPVQEQAQAQPSLPKHAFTVDIVPAVIGLVFGSLEGIADGFLEDMKDEDGVSVSSDISGIGFGLQYEYQTSERTSLAARFSYLGLGATVKQIDKLADLEAKLKGDVTILSAEGHARTYPFGGAFFLDAVLGYSNLSLSFKGEDIVENDYGAKEIESTSFKASQGYFKPGLKLGWRVSFGENGGGFVFEPSFNLCYAIRLGSNSLIKQIAKDTDNDYGDGAKDVDDMLGLIESLALIGGPGFGLSFGYRF
jgi:hypothetical protein